MLFGGCDVLLDFEFGMDIGWMLPAFGPMYFYHAASICSVTLHADFVRERPVCDRYAATTVSDSIISLASSSSPSQMSTCRKLVNVAYHQDLGISFPNVRLVDA